MKNTDMEDDLRETDKRVAAWMRAVEDDDITDSCSIQTEWQQEDRKFASQAVAFVIKHSRKGIVSLCASVATLMQEHANLQKQLKDFQNRKWITEQNSETSSLTSPSSSTSRKYKQKQLIGKYASYLSSSALSKAEQKHYNIIQNGRKTSSASSSLSSKSGLQSNPQIVPHDAAHFLPTFTLEKGLGKGRKLEKLNVSINNNQAPHLRTPKTVKKFSVLADVCQPLQGDRNIAQIPDKQYKKRQCSNDHLGTTDEIILSDIKQSSLFQSLSKSKCAAKKTLNEPSYSVCPTHQMEDMLATERMKTKILKKWLFMQANIIGKQHGTAGKGSNQHTNLVSAPSPLKGCLCNCCWLARSHNKKQAALLWKGRPLLQLNDVVVICGEMIGSVCYIGHIDDCSPLGEVFIGVKLDEAVGNSDGTYQGKHYFKCSNHYGVFLSFHDVLCLFKTPNHSSDSSER